MPYQIVTDEFRGFEVQYHSGNGHWKQCGQGAENIGINTFTSEFRANIYIALRKSGATAYVTSQYIETAANKLGLP